MRVLSVVAAAAFLAMAQAPAVAEPLGPSSGFLGTYVGPQNGDLAITGGQAFYTGKTLTFDATFAAPIGATTTGPVLYVWGVDRGANLPLFGAFRPGVLFDEVAVAIPAIQFAETIDFASNTTTVLPFSDVKVSGDSLSIVAPIGLFPSLGFAPKDYLVNLWTRFGLPVTDNTQIAEFAPSNSDVPVGIPEPATVLIAGGVLAFAGRRRRSR